MANSHSISSEKRDLFTKCRNYTRAREAMAAGFYPFFRKIEATEGSTVTTGGKRRVMIGSNNYLGLTHDPRVIQAGKDALDSYGTGCTGSRFLNGNLDIHEQLEKELAEFLGKESCIVFSTGFFANQGALSSLVGRSDVLYSDRENHASIIEGTRLALGDTIKFRHNDMADLERVLMKTRDQYRGALFVADGVFSMSGDILELPKVLELSRKYDMRVYVDDAHALGVLGSKGQGTSHHFDCVDDVDLVMGTFSKSFASVGGYLAGSEEAIHYVKHVARPFIFSAAMPPASVGAVLKCLDITRTEPQHLENLWKNARYMQEQLTKLGYNTLNSQTPIIPLLVGEDMVAFQFAQELFENGVFATPVASPAVPQGCALIRTSYMASHKREDLDFVLEVLENLGKKFGIIKNPESEERLNMLAKIHFGVSSPA